MLIYAGIDEAGYGPMFGPLVIARSVFVLEARDPAEFEIDGGSGMSLWTLLHRAVCRKASDKKRRIAVNDSKQLYTPAKGLAHLERGVLSFCGAAGVEATTLDELLAAIAYDGASRQPDQLWYHSDDGGPALPTAMDAGKLAIARSQLTRTAQAAGVRVVAPCAAVLFEDRFNHMVAATRSKARCSWTFVAGHLQAIWQAYGQHRPVVVLDRQGGRTRYVELLSLLFEGAEVRIVDESPLASVYEVRGGGRAMILRVQSDSEQHHLPVALASMTAKYVREALMIRFNAFWAQHMPELKPTAGYVKDGRRFLTEIEPVIAKLGIARDKLVRSS